MASSIQYVKVGTQVNGKPALLRRDLATSGAFHLAIELVKIITGFDLWSRIIQAKGGAVLSAGTHSDGAAIDFRVWGMTKAHRWAIVAIFRECGFSASWSRDWTGNYHLHIGADLRPEWTRVTYQCNAARGRFDGLGKGGRGGRDPHPAPSSWRNVKQGASWAKAQLVTHGRPGLPSAGDGPIKPKEDTLSQAEVDAIVAHINKTDTALRAYIQDRHNASNDFLGNRAKLDQIGASAAAYVAKTGFNRDVLEEIGATSGRHVWDANFVGRGDGGKDQVSMRQELADSKSFGRDNFALNVAQAEKLRQINAGAITIDYAQVERVIREALDKTTVTTTTTLGGNK